MSAADAPVRSAARVTVRVDQVAELEIITVLTDARSVTLQLRGEMEFSNAVLLTAVLNSQLGHGHRFMRLDLSRLSFLDCAGLGRIVHAHHRCLAACGTLVLTGVTPRIARLLTLTHLDETLLVADGRPGVSVAVQG